MKRLIIIVVLVLLLAGGGGAAWWFMNQDAEEVESAEAEAAVEEAPRPQFVKMSPIILPLIQQNQVTRFVTILVTLEMTDNDAAIQVALVRPKLEDALFTELHSLLAMKMVHDQGLDSPLVKRRLMRASQKILGEENVTAVLIQGVAQQRPRG